MTTGETGETSGEAARATIRPGLRLALRLLGTAAATLVRVVAAFSIGVSGRAPEPIRPTDPPKPYRP
jgi:hypothetical protein